jgi:hypothetical protein
MIKRILKWALAFVLFIILAVVLLVVFDEGSSQVEPISPDPAEQTSPAASTENAVQFESLGSVMEGVGQAANHIGDAIPDFKELDKLNNVQANIKSAADSSTLESANSLDMKGLDALDKLDGLSSLKVLDGLKPLEMKGLQGLANLAGSAKYVEPAEDAEKASAVTSVSQNEAGAVSTIEKNTAANGEPDNGQTLPEPSAQASPPVAGQE